MLRGRNAWRGTHHRLLELASFLMEDFLLEFFGLDKGGRWLGGADVRGKRGRRDGEG